MHMHMYDRYRKCQECPVGYLQWSEGMTECHKCPPSGVDCEARDRIQLLKGFFYVTKEEAAKHSIEFKGNMSISDRQERIQVHFWGISHLL